MMTSIDIAGRTIGPGQPVFIVAEMSANARSLDEALEIVRCAKAAGADAVKTQTYTADGMTLDCDSYLFQIEWQGQRRTLYDLYQEAAMPWDWQPRVRGMAEAIGLIWFSTAFDCESVDFLESLKVPCHKIASSELTDLPLIRYMASKGRPVILSTGMATRAEVSDGINACNEGMRDGYLLPPCSIALLKCTSGYPAPVAEANLRTIPVVEYQRGIPVGLSDHTLGVAVPVAAVALGACIVEKHLCLGRARGGPDAAFSLEPHEFKAMVQAVRTAEQALGEVSYGPTESERENLRYRRSLFAVRDIAVGAVFTAENIRSIRPSAGLHPRHYDEIIGRRAARDIERGTPLAWELIAKEGS